MKKLIVKDEKIRKNVELVKKLIARQNMQKISPFEEFVQFVLLIDRDTGVLSVKDEKGDLKQFSDHNWKEISFRLQLKGDNTVYEAIKGVGNDLLFQCSDLKPLAYRVMVDTLSTLNKAIHELGKKKLDLLLQDLYIIEGASEERVAELIRRDLIHETWHEVDRFEAEVLLENKPIGTFFFRQDEYALILEMKLQKLYGPDIKSLTFTFLAAPGKISDRTIILWKNKCSLYNDNLSLNGDSFQDIYSLVKKEISDDSMNPLWNH